MLSLGLWIGKASRWLSRKVGYNGTNLPGVIGLKFDKKLLGRLAQQVENIIVVTGTNGKTTTSRLICHMLQADGLNVLANKEGSNMNTGIASAFINEANVFGQIRNVDAAVIEVDEGNLPFVIKDLNPKAMVVTNFFRDQLDRYAEIDQLIHKIKTAIHEVDAHLYLNADDPLTVRLAEDRQAVSYYGIAQGAYPNQDQSLAESKYCECGQTLHYDAYHYGQLGFYSCSCGFKRPNPSVLVQAIEEGNQLTVKVNGKPYVSQLKGAYNAYNIAGAISCTDAFDLKASTIQQGLAHYIPDNGRMERFTLYSKPVMLNLSKNAQGVNSTLAEYLKTNEPKQMVLALNDLEADGQDVSWIWDANYELLNRPDVERIICTGRRAFDMAIRMKYAGVEPDILKIHSSLTDAVQKATEYNGASYVICSYSTLNPIRELLRHHESQQMQKELV